MAKSKTVELETVIYEYAGKKARFPVGTAESLGQELIRLMKANKRVRVVYKNWVKIGYPSPANDHLIILCFDKRSQRGNVMGLRVHQITETRKPYKVIWNYLDDPFLAVMET